LTTKIRFLNFFLNTQRNGILYLFL
jgi:hypothetical protein